MVGSLNKLQIDFLLHSELVGRIGCSLEDKTYIVPITYVYDSGSIIAHTREGLKVEMMRKNKNVCFEVDRIVNLANWQSVVVEGVFEELKGKKADEALQLIVNRIHPMTTSDTAVPQHALVQTKTPQKRDAKMVVFRIRISKATGRFEKQ